VQSVDLALSEQDLSIAVWKEWKEALKLVGLQSKVEVFEHQKVEAVKNFELSETLHNKDSAWVAFAHRLSVEG
jgi:hypothetical protein